MAVCYNQGEHSEYQAELESDSRHQERVGKMTAPTSQLKGKMVSGSGREHLVWYFCSRTISQVKNTCQIAHRSCLKCSLLTELMYLMFL